MARDNSQHGSSLLICSRKIHLIPLYQQKPVPEKLFQARAFMFKVYLVFTTSYFPWLTRIVVLLISAVSSIFLLPHGRNKNKVVWWYTFWIRNSALEDNLVDVLLYYFPSMEYSCGVLVGECFVLMCFWNLCNL